MSLYERIVAGEEAIAVVGLGYVGMPLAVAFARRAKVIGFDNNAEKIDLYKRGIDPTQEVGDDGVKRTTVEFTADAKRLKEAKFHIIAVPTPINFDKTPDLTPVESASRTVGQQLTKGSVVVYESTVYPGVTEDICAPILERESGLVCGRDFKIAYSPERINPGDTVHRLETIVKIVSGMDEETLDTVAAVYELVIEAGVYRAQSIKVAEAAKVVENSQRDLNIAFMNELAMALDRMEIDTKDVVAAMNTKWNALGFTPGLVGGHCIGVDPYYFIYEAEKLGYHSQIILAGRKINDGMGRFVAETTVKKLVQADLRVKRAKVCVFGLTFKEDCPDARNTKVVDIIDVLRDYGIDPIVVDPVADAEDVRRVYGIELTALKDVKDIDCAIMAVPHKILRALPKERIEAFFAPGSNAGKVIIDVKSALEKPYWVGKGYLYWRM